MSVVRRFHAGETLSFKPLAKHFVYTNKYNIKPKRRLESLNHLLKMTLEMASNNFVLRGLDTYISPHQKQMRAEI